MNYIREVLHALTVIAQELHRIRLIMSRWDKPGTPEGANGQQEGEKKDA